MFCRECGNEVNNSAVICPKCGVPVAGKKIVTASDVVVPNHMVGAILTTIFCCQIGGIIAIVYAAKVNTKLAQGDIAGAQASSKSARMWIIINLIVGCIIALVYAIAGAASGQ